MKLKHLLVSCFGAAVGVLSACTSEEAFDLSGAGPIGNITKANELITIETGEITHLGKDTLMLRISGGEEARARGIVYSETNQEPSLRRNAESIRVAMLEDSLKKTGFELGKTYYLRAYPRCGKGYRRSCRLA